MFMAIIATTEYMATKLGALTCFDMMLTSSIEAVTDQLIKDRISLGVRR